ncbi:MAG: tRNA (adenosine(37)-N6)-threonylcarbamoyltransferase complex dimerization subunit type 1 TsaB [Bryobacteraceae bacterium]
MTVLALDTTSETGSLALRESGETIRETVMCSSEGFGHLIFPAIKRILSDSGIRLDRVDCFAAASGPGAFTGIRVGLSAVKGLAEALGKPAAGISNLRAMASSGKSGRRAVVADARRGEVFAAIYDAGGVAMSPEVVAKFSAWLEALDPPPGEFIAPAGSPFRSLLADTRFRETPVLDAPRNLAAAIALCAERDAEMGRLSDPAALDANYVRRSDAEMFWKDA